MIQILLEEVSDVKGIVDACKAGFSFIEVGFTIEGVQVWSIFFSRTEELLCQAEATAKW